MYFFQDKLIIPDLCFICEETTPTIQFNPCGHLICCSSCSKLVKKCPKCRQPIKSKDNMKSIGDLRASSLRQSKKTNSDPKIAKNLNNNRSKNQDTALKSLQAKYDVRYYSPVESGQLGRVYLRFFSGIAKSSNLCNLHWQYYQYGVPMWPWVWA